jgi:ABC-type maltose transport system permease subunit
MIETRADLSGRWMTVATHWLSSHDGVEISRDGASAVQVFVARSLSLPVVLVYIYLHKYMVGGLTAGAVKG